MNDPYGNESKIFNKDRQQIASALDASQNNISLALSYIQAQLWMQSMTAAIIREGEEGTLPTEIQKVIWDNAIDFEKKFQSWWYLANFTYNPIESKATAFVLTIRNASVYTIYLIIALGLNHNGTVLYPIEHRVWAKKDGDKWQTVDVDACITREQQGFICESNTLKAQDICLDTEQNVCHFEIHPDDAPNAVLVYVGKGCVCSRSPCNFIFIDDIATDIDNHLNFCVCNFTNIVGCDFSYSTPVTSHQLLQTNYTLIHDLLPVPIGMDITLVKKLLQHNNLKRLLKEAQENGQKTLITVHHDVKEIHQVLERVKKDGEHKWWDTLFGWSPTATGLFNKMLHPVVVLLILTILCFVLTLAFESDRTRFDLPVHSISRKPLFNTPLGSIINKFRETASELSQPGPSITPHGIEYPLLFGQFGNKIHDKRSSLFKSNCSLLLTLQCLMHESEQVFLWH
ncbi:uncharacterized protein LOC142365708 [Opisthocomus hoazin]|uniref:uncharacterized protein LOC142365708 n=1 Tax=Opisthocomus hoazin TaxID=30419 RepID=UPI003F53C586